MKSILLFITLLLYAFSSRGITYGTNYADIGRTLITTSDGGYLILGYSNSTPSSSGIYLIKINSNLNIEWEKFTGDTFWNEYITSIIEVGNQNGYFALGSASHLDTINGLDEGTLLIRYNSVGDTLWTKLFHNYDQAFGGYSYYIEALNDNEYIMGVDNFFGTFGHDFNLIKIDSVGNIIDTLCGGLPGAILPLSSGYLLTSTDSRSSPGAIVLSECDSPSGFYSAFSDTTLLRIFQAGSSAKIDDGYLTVGSTDYYSTNSGDFQFYMLRINQNGDSLWSKHWNSGWLNGISKINALDYYITGVDAIGSFVSKSDSIGNFIWTKYISSPYSFSELKVLDSIGTFALLGDSLNSSLGTTDVWLAIFDSSGNDITNVISDINQVANDLSFQIFPNPSSGDITIDLGKNYSTSLTYKIQITNLIGEVILFESITSSVLQIDKSVFRAKGVYVVSISSPNNIITTKLIIQ